MRKNGRLLAFLVLGALLGCSAVSVSTPVLRPQYFQQIARFVPPVAVSKCLYSTIDATAFLLDVNTNSLFIWHNNTFNQMGGIGFEASSFTRLSDIALAPDGSLLALDSFARHIKKFSADGNLTATIDLPASVEPVLFAVSSDETIYYYDAGRAELVVYRSVTGEEAYTFGKFDISDPTQIQLVRNTLFVYQKDGSTLMYDVFGQFLEQQGNIIIRDRGVNYKLQENWLEHNYQQFAISAFPWQSASQCDGIIVLVSTQDIFIGRMMYEKR